MSTYGQTFDAQLVELRKEKCTKIYREKASGGSLTGARFRSLAEPWADTATSTD